MPQNTPESIANTSEQSGRGERLSEAERSGADLTGAENASSVEDPEPDDDGGGTMAARGDSGGTTAALGDLTPNVEQGSD